MLLSNRLIAEDSEGGLFTVTLFRKVMDDFKTKPGETLTCFLWLWSFPTGGSLLQLEAS